jgi:glycolate oxidase
VLTRIAELSREYGLRCANVFHAGDGNLHPLIMFDANQAGRGRARHRPTAARSSSCRSRSAAPSPASTASASRRSARCARSSRPEELAAFRGVKAAFDEHTLLNPGKVVPSLHRCAEYGRMHVHHGDVKFPELERF